MARLRRVWRAPRDHSRKLLGVVASVPLGPARHDGAGHGPRRRRRRGATRTQRRPVQAVAASVLQLEHVAAAVSLIYWSDSIQLHRRVYHIRLTCSFAFRRDLG